MIQLERNLSDRIDICVLPKFIPHRRETELRKSVYRLKANGIQPIGRFPSSIVLKRFEHPKVVARFFRIENFLNHLLHLNDPTFSVRNQRALLPNRILFLPTETRGLFLRNAQSAHPRAHGHNRVQCNSEAFDNESPKEWHGLGA